MSARSRYALAVGCCIGLTSCSADTRITGPLESGGLSSISTADKLSPSTTTTMVVNGCQFTVTYTWSGFRGGNLSALFGLYERFYDVDIGIDLRTVRGLSGRNGSVSYTFNLTPNATTGRTIGAGGTLVGQHAEVSGASSESSNTIWSTCG